MYGELVLIAYFFLKLGQWKDNLMHGEGDLTYLDGKHYVGERKQ